MVLLSNTSPSILWTTALTLFLLLYLIRRRSTTLAIRRLGASAPTLEGSHLFGLPFILRSAYAELTYTTHLAWLNLFSSLPGHTGEITMLGTRAILTHNPTNVRAVLKDQFHDFGKGPRFHDEWQGFLGDGIFTTDGQAWLSERKSLRPQFQKEGAQHLSVFEKHMDVFLDACARGGIQEETVQEKKPRAHAAVFDISDLFFRLTLDVTTDFLLGSSANALSNPTCKFARAFDNVQYYQNLIAHLPVLNRFLPFSLLMRRDLHTINTFVSSFLEPAIKPPPSLSSSPSTSPSTFLTTIISSHLPRSHLRDQILSILLAGRDTTAGTLAFALHELARSPAHLHRLRAEISSTLGPDPSTRPTADHLSSRMPFLTAIIKETMRMYPAVPMNSRYALTDTTLPTGGGPLGDEAVGVPKGTLIVYSPLVMQRHPELLPVETQQVAPADVWAPERWEVYRGTDGVFIPFNAGPRICLGQKFAMLEMQYVLVRLFQRFPRLESHLDGGNAGPLLQHDITMKPAGGVKVAFSEDE